jgi:hypothetical protein
MFLTSGKNVMPSLVYFCVTPEDGPSRGLNFVGNILLTIKQSSFDRLSVHIYYSYTVRLSINAV